MFRGLLDEALNQQLELFEQKFNGIVHPKTFRTFQLLIGGLINSDTHDRVSLKEVIQSGLVDKVTASLLKDEKFHTKSLTSEKKCV